MSFFNIDFAVSAPYEGSGFVYIFYGQEMDQAGSIVNTTYQQVTITLIYLFIYLFVCCFISVLMVQQLHLK